MNGPVKTRNDGRDEFFSGRIEEELEKVRVCREAVGSDFDFVLEAHRGMNVPEAITFGNEVAKYRPMVFEDPITPDNPDAMAEVAAKVPVPIATGERFINLKEFETVMARHGCQYIRPDVCAVGGITTSKRFVHWRRLMMYLSFLIIRLGRYQRLRVCSFVLQFQILGFRNFLASA